MKRIVILDNDFLNFLDDNDIRLKEKWPSMDDLSDLQLFLIDEIGKYMRICDGNGFFSGRMITLLKLLIWFNDIKNLKELKNSLLDFSENQNENILLFRKIDQYKIKQTHLDEYFDEFYISFNKEYSLNNIDEFIHIHSSFDNSNNIFYTKQLLKILIKDYHIKNKDELIDLMKNYNLLDSKDLSVFNNLYQDELMKIDLTNLMWRYTK